MKILILITLAVLATCDWQDGYYGIYDEGDDVFIAGDWGGVRD